jgi:hypothetical protein
VSLSCIDTNTNTSHPLAPSANKQANKQTRSTHKHTGPDRRSSLSKAEQPRRRLASSLSKAEQHRPRLAGAAAQQRPMRSRWGNARQCARAHVCVCACVGVCVCRSVCAVRVCACMRLHARACVQCPRHVRHVHGTQCSAAQKHRSAIPAARRHCSRARADRRGQRQCSAHSRVSAQGRLLSACIIDSCIAKARLVARCSATLSCGTWGEGQLSLAKRGLFAQERADRILLAALRRRRDLNVYAGNDAGN